MKSARTKNPVKLLIFKDGEISRSVEVSENWLLRAGLALLALTAITAASAALAFRAYWRTRPFTAPSPTEIVLAHTPAPAVSVPTPAATVTTAPTATAPIAATPSAAELLATRVAKLPLSSQASEANRLDVAALSAAWYGRSINVRFNIQTLTVDSPGARQGRFLVLVYGKNGVAAYPVESIDATIKDQLNLRRGETYSVARFRSVKAVVDPRQGLRETTELRAEVLLLDSNLNLIVRKSIEVTGKPSAVPPVRPAPQAPATSEEAAPAPAAPATENAGESESAE